VGVWIVISGLGLALSIVLHVLALLDIYIISMNVMLNVLYSAPFIVGYCSIIVRMRLTRGVDKKDLKKLMRSDMPKWMLTSTGLLVLYGFVMLVVLLVRRLSGGLGPADMEKWRRASYIARSGGWIALWTIDLLVFWGSRVLRQKGILASEPSQDSTPTGMPGMENERDVQGGLGARKSEVVPVSSSESREIAAALKRQSEDMLRFNCRCGQAIKVPGKYLGRTGKCPKCGARITIGDSQRKATET
jgi:hypothetical protein